MLMLFQQYIQCLTILSFILALENRLGLLPVQLAHPPRVPQLLQLSQSSRDQDSPMVGAGEVTLNIVRTKGPDYTGYTPGQRYRRSVTTQCCSAAQANPSPL